ncbi:hypothetical protein I6F26_00315 [Ensifer sp. IC3342]|nr:hypothetical protein [Ensifer sp. BRP08]MCA1445039.1 hypothetical protein [Ensifer sp. IC3342]
MKQTVKPGNVPDTWHPDALYTKAQRYIENMHSVESDQWEHALWSSFALEFLARAALANVSPALLADNKEGWTSLFHSLGFQPIEPKFTPKSIPVSDVFRRLSSIITEFTKEHADFGILHTGRRNSELHSGEAAFEDIDASVWHPNFYVTCQILLGSMGMSLEDVIGTEEADIAAKLIAAAADESAKSVLGDVARHKSDWDNLPPEQKETLAKSAKVWATRYTGHRVACPACGSTALVVGEAVAVPVRKLEEDEIVETQEYLPSRFECVACRLKISGLSRLTVVGLSARYRKTTVYDAAEYYAPEDNYAGYEDDNNEY